MAFDGTSWSMLNVRCVVPCCDCKCFKPGSTYVRQCDSCGHGWVAHVLAKLNPLPLFPSSLMDGITGAVAYDVVSMILFGTHAIPVKLKILLDRLIPAHLQNDLNRILHVFGWSFQDYSRGYVLLDNLGQARERWTTCGREEEPVILQQFLRFFETRALAYDMLIGQNPRGLPLDFPSQTTPPLSSAETSPLLGSTPRSGIGPQPTLLSGGGGGGKVTTIVSQPLLGGCGPSGAGGTHPVPPPPFPLNHLFPLMSGSTALANFLSSTLPPFPCPVQPLTPGKLTVSEGIKLESSDVANKQRFTDKYSNSMNLSNLSQRSDGPVNKRARVNDPSRGQKSLKRGSGTGRLQRVIDSITSTSNDEIDHDINNKGFLDDDPEDNEVDMGDSNLHDNMKRSRSGSPDSSISGTTRHIDMGSDLIGQNIGGMGRSKKRVLCTTCNKTFCDKGALKIHYSAVHLQEMHKCTMKGCNMWFSSRRSRNRHSANPNPRLHMSQSNKKLPENAVIVDDGTGRPLGERMPIPNSVLNPPVVPVSGIHENDASQCDGPRASSSPFLLSPTDPNTSSTGFTRIHAPVFQIPHHLKTQQQQLLASQHRRNRSCSGSSSHPSSSGLTTDCDSVEPMNLVLSKSAEEECEEGDDDVLCSQQPPKLFEEPMSPNEIILEHYKRSDDQNKEENNNSDEHDREAIFPTDEEAYSKDSAILEESNLLKINSFGEMCTSTQQKLYLSSESKAAVVH